MIVDLHSHILFDIDDGAVSLEESIEMLEKMESDDIDVVYATSHFNPSKDNLEDFLEKRKRSFNKILEQVEIKGLEIKVKLGSELMYSANIANYNLDDLTLNKSDYLLIELSTRRKPTMLKKNLFNLLHQGYIVILAHVERYSYLLEDANLMQELINAGVLFQVNSTTILNKGQKNLVSAMFKNNLIHFVASDAHGIKRRLPNLKESLDEINNTYSQHLPILKENYSKVVNNELISVAKPKKLKKIFNKYF